MTMMTASATTTHAKAPLGRDLLARIGDTLRDWALRRETRLQLERLSDRELTDIGLCRADIDGVVNGNF
ncbi:DUF1127 domain-containing protein [Paracoccus jeotgali]|nr:DUF1127 domain-containing protein [Paracoccus jeotgali]